jgi:type I restriction-modification system DNA methylase subunit
MSAKVDYEAELWKMADLLRHSMDAAEYKYVVLGLIFLKYISDALTAPRSWVMRPCERSRRNWSVPCGRT